VRRDLIIFGISLAVSSLVFGLIIHAMTGAW